MRTPVAWLQLTHGRVRTLTALGGVSFAILLVFLQLGFYASCETSATMLHDLLAFDVVLVSPHYLALRESGSVPERRLRQALALEEVIGATPVHIGVSLWRNHLGDLVEVLVFGVDPMGRPFALPEIASNLGLLTRNDVALVDRGSHRLLGPSEDGRWVEVGRRRIRLEGGYVCGTGFNALGAILVNEATFQGLQGGSLDSFQLGLLRLAPGADPDRVAAQLLERLPRDMRALTRHQLFEEERSFWLGVKPVGLMFTSGVVVAFLVGTVILYQVLSADVASHLREYATLKAIGYRTARIQLVVIQQGLLLSVLGFVPAAVLAALIYKMLRVIANVPVDMPPGRLLFVLLLAIGMCSLSSLLALRRVAGADPAELF